MSRIARRLLAGCSCLAAVVACSRGDGGDAMPAPDGGSPGTPGGGSPEIVLAANGRLATGADVCTRPSSDEAERWCAFLDGAGAVWAINLSAAAAGPAPTCDGNDQRCRKLGAPAADPPRFKGEYLQWKSLTRPGDAYYHGTVFLWHPSWPQPRPLTGPEGDGCQVHPASGAILCTESTDARGENVFRRVGRLAHLDAGLPPMSPALAEKYLTTALSPRGEYVLAQAYAPGTGSIIEPFPLRAVAVDSPATSTRIADRVMSTRWEVSRDEGRIYYQRGETGTALGGAWELVVADFPGGQNARVVHPYARSFRTIGHPNGTDRGVLALTPLPGAGGGHILRLFAPADGGATRELGSVLADRLYTIDEGLGHLVYTAATAAAGPEMLVTSLDLRAPGCAFAVAARQTALSASLRAVFWTEETGSAPVRERLHAAPVDDCKAKRLVSDVVFYWQNAPEARGVFFVHGLGLHFSAYDEPASKARLIIDGTVVAWAYEPRTNALLVARNPAVNPGVLLVRNAL